MATKTRRTIDPERIREEALERATNDMHIFANEMGAITPGELGQYTRGWGGKKKKINTYLSQNCRYAEISEAVSNAEMNYNHCHGERGRFCSTGGGGGSGGGSAKDKYIESGGKQREWMKEAAKYVFTETGKNGGGTFQFKDDKPESVKNGIMVADHPEKGKIKQKMKENDVEKYIDKHSDTLDSQHAIGTWQNEGKTYLDVVRIFPLNKEAEAIKAGKAANQIAIGKLVNGVYSEIQTGGTGEIPK